MSIGKAFRHGDIEGILSELAKTAGHAVGGGGLIGFAQSVLSTASGGAKFSKEDVKRVYFVSILDHFTCFFLVIYSVSYRETGSEIIHKYAMGSDNGINVRLRFTPIILGHGYRRSI